MNKPHKHAEIIKQWADGAEIEWYSYFSEEWYDASLSPAWDDEQPHWAKSPQKLSRGVVWECRVVVLSSHQPRLRIRQARDLTMALEFP